jgi:hypothetical protein
MQLADGTDMNAPRIIPTYEVRWFLKGSDPSGWEIWFDERFKNFVQTEAPRVDRYLVFPNTDFAGVKLREYERKRPGDPRTLNIEFKLRDSVTAPEVLCDGVTGLVEAWRKWSQKLETSEADFVTTSGIPQVTWQTVPKQRKLARYRASSTGGELITPGTPQEQVPSGCTIEFTRLSDQSATLGFEAFGDETHLRALLQMAVRDTFAKEPRQPQALTLENSCGYPAWIMMRK